MNAAFRKLEIMSGALRLTSTNTEAAQFAPHIVDFKAPGKGVVCFPNIDANEWRAS